MIYILDGESTWKLKNLLEPDKFDNLIDAVQKECGFSRAQHEFERNSFTTPSLALKAGYSLKDCAGILYGMALRQGNDELLKIASSFQKLYKLEWKKRITKAALQTLKDRRCRKPQLLPTIEDLKCARDQLANLCITSRKDLTEHPCEKNRKMHAENCATRLMLFNKRRSKEVFLMTKTAFEARNLSKQNMGAFSHALSAFEKSLVDM